MKKIPYVLLITLTFGITFGVITPAGAVVSDGGLEWWSVPELLAYASEADAEKDATCHGDNECEMEYHFARVEEDAEYRALDELRQNQFWLTSINIERETVKVLFFDEDAILRRIGIKERSPLEHFYLGWEDRWTGQIFHYDPIAPNLNENMHQAYVWRNNSGADFPVGREVEISIAGSDIAENTTGLLAEAAFAGMFNSRGSFYYGSCFDTPGYTPDKDCKIRFSGNLNYRFSSAPDEVEPAEPDNPTTNPTEPEPVSESDNPSEPDPNLGPEPEPDNPLESIAPTEPSGPSGPSPASPMNSAEPRPEPGPELEPVGPNPTGSAAGPTVLVNEPIELASAISTGEPIAAVATSANTNIGQRVQTMATTTSAAVDVPNLGSTCKHIGNDFPWWLVALLVSSDIVIMWLFWPKAQKNSKKRYK